MCYSRLTDQTDFAIIELAIEVLEAAWRMDQRKDPEQGHY